MNKEMTFAELIERKKRLESDLQMAISDLVEKFTTDTGICLKGVEVQMITSTAIGGHRHHHVGLVEVDLGLDDL